MEILNFDDINNVQDISYLGLFKQKEKTISKIDIILIKGNHFSYIYTKAY